MASPFGATLPKVDSPYWGVNIMRFSAQNRTAFQNASSKTATGKNAKKRSSFKTSLFKLSAFAASGIALVALLFALATIFIPWPASLAATPASGTIGPSGPTNTWIGPPTGGASANESTCVDGVNCDVYALNVSGTATDWAGKLIAIKIG